MGQSSANYAAYKMRASFYAAAARTLEGMIGVVFRKEPDITWPESDLEYLESIGEDDTTLISVMKHAFQRIISLGRHGILLDVGEDVDEVVPYMVHYSALNIINWRKERYKGQQIVTMLVLKEIDYIESVDDRYTLVPRELIRILYLTLPGALYPPQFVTSEADAIHLGSDPVYQVEVYERYEETIKNNKMQGWRIIEIKEPKIRGNPLSFIPFVLFGVNDLGPEIDKSPLIDVCNINLSHYRTSADLEHGRHFTALPTPWVAGFKPETVLEIGSQVAWVSEDPNAKADFLEFTGTGLKALERALEQKEAQMVVLGARLLESPKRAVESAETLQTRRASEDSVVASIAGTVSTGFTKLLKWAAEWACINRSR